MTTSKTGPSCGGSVSTERLECLSPVPNITKRSSYSWTSTSNTDPSAHQVPSLPSTSLAGARGQAQSHGQVLPNRPGVAPLRVPATSTASPGSNGPTFEVTTGEV